MIKHEELPLPFNHFDAQGQAVMVATTVAALTVYDMCKGADKRITIDNVALLYKEGGKSGVFRREEEV